MKTFQCSLCGESWDQHPALAVECPKCLQSAGSPCIRPSGHYTYGGVPHSDREQLAVDRGLMTICPEGATAKREREAVGPLFAGAAS